ncbi:hypothetical protein ACES2I_16595 [Bdellovibrio bacteriovorus]|uniref:hypothetical protein n=1 Tax=Bdellovibrio bacteriovorus TaxID=959 RepID=UPI0035A72AD9
MKTIQLLSTALVMTMLTACAGGGGSDDGNAKANSVDANGYCTQEFVTNYNNVLLEFNHLQILLGGIPNEDRILAQMKAAHGACKKLFPQHEDVTCKAEVKYEITDISSNTFKEGCKKTEEGLKQLGQL